ncbi:MAG: hypothetical protein KGM47_12160 [Acidobacteriota bacterium]|nr:hypothetical protein [Acidobacteriota bacterium]
MGIILKAISLFMAVATVLILSGCPLHRGGTRLVYVPSPPAGAGEETAKQGNVLVIPAPPPPAAPSATAPKRDEAPEPVTVDRPVRRRRVVRDQPPSAVNAAAGGDEAAGTALPAAAAGAPQLSPARSPQQQGELKKEIGELRDGIHKRIDLLKRKPLSRTDREAVKDAQLFLSQADEATQQGNLQQALNLSQKADLLIAAVEKRY